MRRGGDVRRSSPSLSVPAVGMISLGQDPELQGRDAAHLARVGWAAAVRAAAHAARTPLLVRRVPRLRTPDDAAPRCHAPLSELTAAPGRVNMRVAAAPRLQRSRNAIDYPLKRSVRSIPRDRPTR